MKRNLLFALACVLSSYLFAQNGDKYFTDKDYARAQFAYEREVTSNPALYLKLAKSYFALQKFDEAINALELYKTKYSGADVAEANKWIELLKRDDEMVRVENLGGTINSSDADFLPRILQDGKTLYFISDNRAGGSGNEDVFVSKLDEQGNWTKAQQVYQFNTRSNEGLLSISPDEKVAILFGNYPGSFGSGDLFYSVKTETGWSTPCNIGGTINSKKWESLACVGPDGKTVIYCTDNDDGRNSEMFVTFLTEEGWTKPKSLGNVVNTAKEDKFPFLAADGKTLYFSSNGHPGFGEDDIFVSRRLDDSWTNWSTPVNLGKYINTLDSDKDLSIPASGKMAYVVRNGSPDGYGGADIYKFLMPYSMRPEQLFKLYGNVYNEKDSFAQVNIKFIDMATNIEVTKATSNDSTGYYSAALPLNKKYLAVIDMKGYLYYSEVIDLTDPDKYRKRYTFQQKIIQQRSKLDAIKYRLDSLNTQLGMLNLSNNEKLRETFEAYEKQNKIYRATIDEMDALVYQAKYDWMTETTEDLQLQKDFHVKRAQIGVTFELKNIFFDLGKASLREDSKKELDKLYEILSNSDIVIELGGHTDSIGRDESNQTLSQERVNSVKTYLTDKGIADKRILAVGYGENFPVAPNSTEQGRQLNRRVEAKILKLTQDKEGSDVVTEADKKKKIDPIAAAAIKKGEMLPLLQAAARKGGLPSGSECNTVYKPVTYNNNNYKPTKQKNNGGSWFGNGDELDLDDNILKTFSVSLLNHSYNSMGMSQGVSMTFVRDENHLAENHLEYYFANPDSVKWGAGYTNIRSIQLGPTISIPLNILWGWETKLFYGSETSNFLHLNIPLGLRSVFNVGDFVLGPEAIYSIGVLKNTGLVNNASHLKFGVNARWKFVQAGVFKSIGKEIDFLGYRVGVTF
ncbi:MAG: OmpA family protein [Bacteroidia bacterium]|nr:OmpA family protein [Bacteroidia bacterium]MBP9688376.1 OmpA family protein [Bacteroidia bacterium]